MKKLLQELESLKQDTNFQGEKTVKFKISLEVDVVFDLSERNEEDFDELEEKIREKDVTNLSNETIKEHLTSIDDLLDYYKEKKFFIEDFINSDLALGSKEHKILKIEGSTEIIK